MEESTPHLAVFNLLQCTPNIVPGFVDLLFQIVENGKKKTYTQTYFLVSQGQHMGPK